MGTKKSGGNKQNLVSTEDPSFTQHFYFSKNNKLKKLSVAPTKRMTSSTLMQTFKLLPAVPLTLILGVMVGAAQ